MRSCRPLVVVVLLALVASTGSAAVPAEAPPALEVLGTHPTEGLKLAITGAELKHTLRIQSTTAGAVDSLRGVVTPLRDSAGQLQDVTWDLAGKGADTAVPVPALGSVPLTLTAKLPSRGTYTAELFLVYGKVPVRSRLTVTRGPTPLPVEVLGLLPVMDTADVFGGSEASLSFMVQETSGQGVSLSPVAVFGVSRVAKDAIQPQASFALKDATPLKLKGGLPQPVQVDLEGLQGAGEYRGTLRLSGPGMQPVDREFRVFLKEGWWVALGWICLGVGVSWGLRRSVQWHRPRLDAQRAALLLREELEQEARAAQPLDDTERRVLISVQGELDRLVAQVGANVVKPADAAPIQARLLGKRELFPKWLWVRRQVRETQPASLREPFETRLDKAQALLTQGGATPAELAEARTDVEKIPADIEAAVRNSLKDAIATLAGEVEAQREDMDASLRAKLLAEVSPDVTAARKVLEQGGANAVKEASALYARARRTYLDLLANQLAADLSAAPPYGFVPEVWDDLKKQVLHELEPARNPSSDLEEAFDSYERAHRVFLTRIARALLDALPGLVKQVEQSTNLLPEEKVRRKEELVGQTQALETVLTLVREGKLRQAAVMCATVRRNLQRLSPTVNVRGGTVEKLLLALVGTAALAPPAAMAGPGGAFPVVGHAAPLSLEAVSRRRNRIDVGVSLALAVIAGLLGVLSLWANDLTWGGWVARFTAFLWGLGLHQATFTTLSGLETTIVGGKESSP